MSSGCGYEDIIALMKLVLKRLPSLYVLPSVCCISLIDEDSMSTIVVEVDCRACNLVSFCVLC